MSIYDQLQPTADRLMSQFTQGAGILLGAGETTGPAWNPQPGEPTTHPFSFTKMAGRMLQQYRDGGYITETDIGIIASRMDVEPVLSDRVTLDGVEYQVVMADLATLVQGKPMVWRLGLRR